PTVCPSATVTLYRVHFDTASSAKTSTPSLLDALPIFSRQQVRPRLGWLRNLPTVSAKTVQQTRMVTKLQKVLNLRVRRRRVLSSTALPILRRILVDLFAEQQKVPVILRLLVKLKKKLAVPLGWCAKKQAMPLTTSSRASMSAETQSLLTTPKTRSHKRATT